MICLNLCVFFSSFYSCWLSFMQFMQKLNEFGIGRKCVCFSSMKSVRSTNFQTTENEKNWIVHTIVNCSQIVPKCILAWNVWLCGLRRLHRLHFKRMSWFFFNCFWVLILNWFFIHSFSLWLRVDRFAREFCLNYECAWKRDRSKRIVSFLFFRTEEKRICRFSCKLLFCVNDVLLFLILLFFSFRR